MFDGGCCMMTKWLSGDPDRMDQWTREAYEISKDGETGGCAPAFIKDFIQNGPPEVNLYDY